MPPEFCTVEWIYKIACIFHVIYPLFGLSDKFLVTPYMRGSFNMFPDFFHMATFIDSTYMKL